MSPDVSEPKAAIRDPESPKLFGKYSDLILLLLGFILTTLVGTFITYKLQNRSWENQDRAQRLADEKSKASDQFENLSKMLDSRLYHTRRLYWGFTDDFGSETARQQQLVTRREKYQEVVFTWNENLSRNISLTQRYFGMKMRSTLEKEVIGEFVLIGNLLEKQKQQINTAQLQEVDNRLTSLQSKVFGFNVAMIQLIQMGEVGMFNKSVAEETQKTATNTNLVMRLE